MLTRGRKAQALASPDTVLSPLPRCFVRAVFLILPADTRLRCSEVSRAWQALLADASLWSCISLSASSGLERFNEALLHAAVAKAGGQLRALDLTGQFFYPNFRLQRDIITTNAATLTELRFGTKVLWGDEGVCLVLETAPALQLLEISVSIDQNHQGARAMLRNEPPFKALRMRRYIVRNLQVMANVVAFCLDLRYHKSIEELVLDSAALDTAATMGAFVGACMTLRLRKLTLDWCRIAPATLAELTRLISAGVLRELVVFNRRAGIQMFDLADHEPTRLFVTAVRASAMTRLQLSGFDVLPDTVVEAAASINARSLITT